MIYLFNMEYWKVIPGYEGYYEVSDTGRVKSLARTIPHPIYGYQPIRERILKQIINSDGYLHVSLHKEGKRKTFSVHVLVARCFLSGLPHQEVNHTNGNKKDNAVGNLDFVSHKENMNHAFDTGLCRNKKQLVEASNGVTYESITAASKALNINAGHLYQALTGKLKHAKGYTFRRVVV